MEKTPTTTNNIHDDDYTMMNTPQFLNYFSSSTEEDMTISSPIQSSRLTHKHHHSTPPPSSSSTTTALLLGQQASGGADSSNQQFSSSLAHNSSNMMNVALTMLLLSPSSKKNKPHSSSMIMNTPSRKTFHTLNDLSSPCCYNTPRSSRKVVRRTLDFDESIDSFEEVSLLDQQENGLIKNTYHNEDDQSEMIMMGLESSYDLQSTDNLEESQFVSYFNRVISLLLAVLLYPTKMMKKETQSSPIVVIPDNHHHVVNNNTESANNTMLDNVGKKIEYQQKRIDGLETIIKTMSKQIDELVKYNAEFEKKVNNLEEKSQKEEIISSITESVDTTIHSLQQGGNSTTLSLESIPKSSMDPNFVILFIVLPIMIALISIL